MRMGPSTTVAIWLLYLFLFTKSLHATDNSDDMVKKEGGTLEQCAKACIEEATIKCRYFKFINSTKTCLLSGTDHPDIKNYFQPQTFSGTQISDTQDNNREQLKRILMITREAYNEQKHRLEKISAKITGLQSEYAKMQQFKSDLGDLTDELKSAQKDREHELKMLQRDRALSNHAQKLMTQKLRDVAVQTTNVKSSLNNIKDTQRTFSTEIEALRQAENDMYGNVVQINRKTTNLNTAISNIQNAEGNIRNQLQRIDRNSHNRDMQMESIRKEFLAGKADAETLKPEVVGLEKNQKTLARALETVAHKVESLGGYLTGFEKSLDNIGQKMSRKLEDEKELSQEVKTITRALKDMRIDINKLLNPQSSLNMERSQGLLKMKSDINLLSNAIHQLQQDNKGQKMDMTNLVRDLANVQLSSQDMKNQLSIVARANKQLQAVTSSIQETERQKPSVVEVAQMHKRVLVALRSMENKEARLLDKVQQYQQAVNQIAARVKNAQESNNHLRRSQIQYGQSIKQLSANLAALGSKVTKLEIPLKFSNGKAKISPKVISDIVNLKDELGTLKSSVEKLKGLGDKVKTMLTPEFKIKETKSENIVNKIIQEARKQQAERNAELIKIQVKPEKEKSVVLTTPKPIVNPVPKNVPKPPNTFSNVLLSKTAVKANNKADPFLKAVKQMQKEVKKKLRQKERRRRRKRRRRRRRRRRKGKRRRKRPRQLKKPESKTPEEKLQTLAKKLNTKP